MKYNIGDKVRIHPDRIKEYHDDVDENKGASWCSESPELFKPGRVFTIRKYDEENNRYYIDGHMGGGWRENLLVPHCELPEDLFNI